MNTIDEAILALSTGGMAVVVDDEDRENEGDLLMDARFATAETVNFMARYGRGLVCVPMAGARLEELELAQMVTRNTDAQGTAFTVSADLADSTTGISAAERAATIRALASASSAPGDFRRPGHVFPLAAREGGVLARRGHTEAAVDFSRLARDFAAASGAASGATLPPELGPPAGVICEIMNEDGSMARLPQLEAFAREHGLPLVSIEELVRWRRARERLVERAADTTLPTRYGERTEEHTSELKSQNANSNAVLC